MACRQLASPEEQIRELQEKLRRFTEFAIAHELWEVMFLNDDGFWFDQMPRDILKKFEEVQRLRNQAMGV